MYYTYLVKREKERGIYIGYTSDLRRRIKEHNTGQKCELLYYEAYLNEDLARRR